MTRIRNYEHLIQLFVENYYEIEGSKRVAKMARDQCWTKPTIASAFLEAKTRLNVS